MCEAHVKVLLRGGRIEQDPRYSKGRHPLAFYAKLRTSHGWGSTAEEAGLHVRQKRMAECAKRRKARKEVSA